MKELLISNGLKALVDDDVYEKYSHLNWHSVPGRNGATYVVTRKNIDGKRKTMYLHRMITGAPNGMMVDHGDFNPLNNQRENLRVCTPSESSSHRRIPRSKNTKYRGIHQQPSGRWHAKIDVQGKAYYIASCKTQKQAALYYNVAAQIFYGKFAQLNLI